MYCHAKTNRMHLMRWKWKKKYRPYRHISAQYMKKKIHCITDHPGSIVCVWTSICCRLRSISTDKSMVKQGNSKVWLLRVYWCFTSYATIFQLNVWRHRCTHGLAPKRHRHFVGFFNVPFLQRHGATLFIWFFREIAPFSRLLRHAGDTEDVLST